MFKFLSVEKNPNSSFFFTLSLFLGSPRRR